MARYFFRRRPDIDGISYVDILNKDGEAVIRAIPYRIALLDYGNRPFVSDASQEAKRSKG